MPKCLDLTVAVGTQVYAFTVNWEGENIGGAHQLASFPGSRSRKGEESLVTLGGLNRGLPPQGFSRNQSDCRTKTREHVTIL